MFHCNSDDSLAEMFANAWFNVLDKLLIKICIINTA